MKGWLVTTASARSASTWMLGLVLFLLFAAHVALPCVVAAQLPRLSPQGGMCQEHKFFQADLDVNALFKIPVPEPLRIPVVPLLLAAFFVAAACAGIPAAIARLRRFPGHRMRGRPFSSSSIGFLPAFAAQRDA